ncbi:MAG TPA: ATP-binding protein [Spirochaetota bacterium]|nr:ATP-binding protein [Spirochaetota bacterium]HNT11160.1 ATP-binding protein [Spirochaetota bacterium]HNV46075.1 ATP-binding protein [Spirochaetota bacterium]HPI23814.1 ATP-binding protein [Spirochaetota bacterium]HPU87339.1 ATP-binding protein [Spirochaetota bacterium]
MDLSAIKRLDVILLCGVYGAGKTEFAQRFLKQPDRSRVSRNEIRKMMFEMTRFGQKWTAADFTEEDDILVKHIERKVLEHFLFNKRRVLVINTFATKRSRQGIVGIAKQMNKTIGAVFLNIPLEKCLLRYKEHNPTLPERVITSMFNKIELPDRREGFTDVLVVTDF